MSALSKQKFVVGAALPHDELAAWQEATGLDRPAVVPLGLVAHVGNCTLTLDVTSGELPKVAWKDLMATSYRPRSHWYRPPVKGSYAARNKPWKVGKAQNELAAA